MRTVFLDTETTGIKPEEGHRLIELCCLEMIDNELSGRQFHCWLNPYPAKVEEEAIAIHGVSNEFLENKPAFSDITDEFLAFINGAQLVIHNAPFDLAFLRHELQMVGIVPDWIEQHCTVVDTYELARQLFPGQRNTLSALCERFGINADKTKMSGAMLDAALLAEIYIQLRKSFHV